MNIHKNARTTLWSRREIVKRVSALGQPVAVVAASLAVCERTVRKWLARYRAEQDAGLRDRSCRPHRSPRATAAGVVAEIARLRRQRWTGAQIAHALQLGRSTVARLLGRLGLARLRQLEPGGPAQRYECAQPGELLHVDTKKLGRIGRIGHRITGDRRRRVRGIGWEYVHVAVDDCSRLSYAEVLPDERGVAMAAFLRRAIAWFRRRGVRVQRILSDNGSGYRSRLVAAVCHALALVHSRTRPYTPRTNGKAERFIQTLLREWAYVRPYRTSHERTTVLPRWLHYYNWHRRHSSLGARPPISRLLLTRDDLVRLHT
jgi:transposase InsO family protein